MPFYHWTEMERSVISPHYSSAEGPTIKGGNIEVGRYRYAAGTGAKPHKHPEEQLVNVLSGKMRFRVGAEERILGPGDAVLIPPNMEHEASAVDGEVEIISCKSVVAETRFLSGQDAKQSRQKNANRSSKSKTKRKTQIRIANSKIRK
jgi:quercetin dioxygenase-like cupin family protein